MKRFFLTILLIVLVVAVGGFFFLPGYLSKTHNTEDVEFRVESGDSLYLVAERLHNMGVIRSRLWFRYKGEDIATKIRPGTYQIEKGATLDEIYRIIQQGEQEVPVIVTFPEGFILYQFAEKIEESGLGTMDEFIDATEEYYLNNYADLYENSRLYFSLEGYLFPDTYHFSPKQTIPQIVERLVSTTENLWTEEMEMRREELGLTRHQVLTLASLIEREAYDDSERTVISGVMYNRMNIGMPLQIDATVIYGIGEGREHMTRVLYRDYQIDDPFNTYRIQGIPPGPIASPGRNSINAALFPDDHGYFYYVMSERGHVFAETYQEHLRNVEAYRQLQ